MTTQAALLCDVVIVNYNAGEFLPACVASVIPQDVQNIIVVDNASHDRSVELLEQAMCGNARLQVIRNARNVGFAAACNLGYRASGAAYVLFLNPDATLASGTLARLIAVLEATPDAGMAGGLLCNPDGSEQAGGRRVFPTPRRAFMRAFGLSSLAKFFPRLFSDFLLHEEPLPAGPADVEAISGACMLVKRQAVEEVGLWDEAYFLHCEDIDWCMRFKQKGWRVLFVPDAKVHHHKGACSQSRPVFVEWHKHSGMVRFYRKFFRRQYPGVLMWLVVAAVWVRFVIVAVKGMLARAWQVLRPQGG